MPCSHSNLERNYFHWFSLVVVTDIWCFSPFESRVLAHALAAAPHLHEIQADYRMRMQASPVLSTWPSMSDIGGAQTMSSISLD
eukprot:4287566-Amphidinium_carterae.1